MTSEQREPTLRLFTAIPLTHEVRAHVVSIAAEMAQRVDGVRWVPEENLHVTLRFIGNCGESKVGELVTWMEKAARHLPFMLLVGGAGGFPSQASARVIWVGAQDASGGIAKVYNTLDKGADRCGFGRQSRKYRPHITVGRARKKPVRLPPELVERFEADELPLEVGELVLYRSDLDSTGAKYTEVARVGPGAGRE